MADATGGAQEGLPMIECPDIPDILRRPSPTAQHEEATVARKRKAKDIEAEEPQTEEDETEEAAVEGNGIGHNRPPVAEMTEEQRQALFFQHKKAYSAALAIKKDADAKFKNACKLAKAELGKGVVQDIKDAILLETEDGEVEFQERMQRAMRVARYMGAAYGTQFDMFDISGVPATERAADEGKRAGMEGKPCASPYDPSVPQHDAWIEGWQAGQRAIFAIQREEDGALFEASEGGAEEAAVN